MGRPTGWMVALTGRSKMKSPGAPSLRREVQRAFWREIAKGLSSEQAAVAVGAPPAAGSRWFREGGGMPLIDPAPLSGRYLSFSEREEIAILEAEGRRAGDGAALGALAVDDLAGAATPCGDAGRPAGVPGLGGAVEGGAFGQPTQDSQARRR
jgi:hypothetical protein